MSKEVKSRFGGFLTEDILKPIRQIVTKSKPLLYANIDGEEKTASTKLQDNLDTMEKAAEAALRELNVTTRSERVLTLGGINKQQQTVTIIKAMTSILNKLYSKGDTIADISQKKITELVSSRLMQSLKLGNMAGSVKTICSIIESSGEALNNLFELTDMLAREQWSKIKKEAGVQINGIAENVKKILWQIIKPLHRPIQQFIYESLTNMENAGQFSALAKKLKPGTGNPEPRPCLAQELGFDKIAMGK